MTQTAISLDAANRNRLRQPATRPRQPRLVHQTKPSIDQLGRSQIVVKSLRGIELVPVEDVRCFLAGEKYVTIHHGKGKTITNESLCSLETEFGGRFLRVHRNALVAVKFIDGLERTALGCHELRVMGVPERVRVSRRRAATVRRAIAGNA